MVIAKPHYHSWKYRGYTLALTSLGLPPCFSVKADWVITDTKEMRNSTPRTMQALKTCTVNTDKITKVSNVCSNVAFTILIRQHLPIIRQYLPIKIEYLPYEQ